MRSEGDSTTASVAKVKAGTIVGSGATVKGVTANNVDIASRGGVTSVVVKDVQVGGASGGGRGDWQHQHRGRAAVSSRTDAWKAPPRTSMPEQ